MNDPEIVAGFIYGICSHAYCEEIIFQSVLPSFIKGIRVFVGKSDWHWISYWKLMSIKWASDQKVNARMHEE